MVERGSEQSSGAPIHGGRMGSPAKVKKPMKSATKEGRPRFEVEIIALSELKPHPMNYRSHPEDQLEHLTESVQRFGVYRNVVCARDKTILAGHGVVAAARKAGLESIPVMRLDLAPEEAAAVKLLVADNEIEHLAEQDDRKLSNLLKWIKDTDERGLLGTGYDEMMVANLLMATRPASEVADFDAAAEWVGMPEYESGEPAAVQVVVSFRTNEAFREFAARLGVAVEDRKLQSQDRVWKMAMWYPPEHRDDNSALKFEA
jgi:hypothetical protein